VKRPVRRGGALRIFELVLITVPFLPTLRTDRDVRPSWCRVGADASDWPMSVGDKVTGAIFDVDEPCFVEGEGPLSFRVSLFAKSGPLVESGCVRSVKSVTSNIWSFMYVQWCCI
jgi:hypothetical protein